jgi:ABC-type dipeptide/oligopeptide/nickel transport system ATPase subunit
MDTQDDTDAPAVITATGLGVDGEHGPLFSGIDLALPEGFHAIQMPGGPGQTTLLMTLAGRFKPSHGTLTVRGDTKPRAIRRHCAIAAFPDIDELEESVTVQTVLAEQRRWLAPWYAQIPREAGQHKMSEVFGDADPPSTGTYIVELTDLQLFLLRITLATLSDRPILVVGDLEQVRDNARRAIAVERLGALATQCTVVVGVTNPLGSDAPEHELHDHRILTEGD